MFGFGQHSPFLRFALSAAAEACDKFRKCVNGPGNGPGFLTAAIEAYQPEDVVFIWGVHLTSSHPSQPRVTYHTFEGSWNPSHRLWLAVCPLGADKCRALELRLQRGESSAVVGIAALLLLPLDLASASDLALASRNGRTTAWRFHRGCTSQHTLAKSLKSTSIKDSLNFTRNTDRLYCTRSCLTVGPRQLLRNFNYLIIQVGGIVGLASVPMIEHRPLVGPGPHREVEACELGLVE